MSVVGASQYRATATLATVQGYVSQSAGVFDNISNSLLDAGRRSNRNGVGLSSGARRNLARLQQSAAEFNSLFSLSGGTSSDIDTAQKQILALRSKTPSARLSREVRELTEGVGADAIDNAETDDTEEATTSSSVLSGGSLFNKVV